MDISLMIANAMNKRNLIKEIEKAAQQIRTNAIGYERDPCCSHSACYIFGRLRVRNTAWSWRAKNWRMLIVLLIC